MHATEGAVEVFLNSLASYKKVCALGALRRKVLSKLLQSDNGYALVFGEEV